jgi:GDP/UDP-N,N'-diacetylbacillosamine 2-epimerase (hydrolysing)
MKKIAFFTTTRAEFGILTPLIKKIEHEPELDYLLFVGGMHLAEEYGNTISEIRYQKFKIYSTFDYLLNNDTPESLVKSLGIAHWQLSNIFSKFEFDFVCIVGDRFELLTIITNGILFNKPIIHLHGGETTMGAIDEQIRHMVTKASHLHFVSCEKYAENIRKLAEPDFRIFNTGALAVDNIKSLSKISKQTLFKNLNIKTNLPTVILTYHPVTMEFNLSIEEQMKNIFKALDAFQLQVIVTSPNIDVGSETVMKMIRNEMKNENRYYFQSLGMEIYLNLIPHCSFVIGNSSSGILEVPFFKIPTINIGDRQAGRIKHESIIDTDYSSKSIILAIDKALSSNFINELKNMKYKFGEGNTAEKMIRIIKSIKIDQAFLRKESYF